MAVTYVAAGTPAATSATLPAGTTSGDWVVVFAYRAGSTAQPTLPASWTQIINVVGASANSTLVAYRVYDGVWTMPTFTNATRCVSFTVRAGAGASLAVGVTQSGGKSQSNIVWDTVTMQNSSGSSAAFRGVVHTRPDAAPGALTSYTIIDANGTQPGYGTYRWIGATNMNTGTVTISRNTTYYVAQIE